jgi:ribonucleoside-diphosphate reductase alpha chain
MHRDAIRGIQPDHVQTDLFLAAQESWDAALQHGEKFGYKNSQVTVLAPTGTIGFMMDCDTTGIEPDLALVKHKKLVGGGLIKIVNNTVPEALM